MCAVPTSTLGVCAVSNTDSVSVLRSALCIFIFLNAACVSFVPFRCRLTGQADHFFSIQSLFRKSAFSSLVVLHSISDMPATNHSLRHAQAQAEIASVQEVLQLVLCGLIFFFTYCLICLADWHWHPLTEVLRVALQLHPSLYSLCAPTRSYVDFKFLLWSRVIPGSHAICVMLYFSSYTGMDGGTCTACAAGSYKPVTGSAACTLCSTGTYSGSTAGIPCTRFSPSHSTIFPQDCH